MDKITHIIPVGHTKETLIGSLRRYPITKVILVLGDKPELESEKKARDIAKKLRRDLGTIPCEEIYVNLDDVLNIALILVNKIKTEIKKGYKVMINLSGSLRSVNIAGYIAAVMTSTPAYVGIPEYDKENIVGVKNVIEVPLIPVEELFSEKMEIINFLNSVDSAYLEDVIKEINPDIDEKNLDKERSRLSYHIKDLKKAGLVISKKEGRKVKLSLSEMGKLYIQGLSIKNIRNDQNGK